MLAAVAARHTPLPFALQADLVALHCGAGCRWDAHVSVANEWVPKLPALTVDQADTLRKLAAQGSVTANSRLASQACARPGPGPPTYGCSFGSRRVCGRHNATTAGAAGSGAEHARVRRRAAAPVQHAVERHCAMLYRQQCRVKPRHGKARGERLRVRAQRCDARVPVQPHQEVLQRFAVRSLHLAAQVRRARQEAGNSLRLQLRILQCCCPRGERHGNAPQSPPRSGRGWSLRARPRARRPARARCCRQKLRSC